MSDNGKPQMQAQPPPQVSEVDLVIRWNPQSGQVSLFAPSLPDIVILGLIEEGKMLYHRIINERATGRSHIVVPQAGMAIH